MVLLRILLRWLPLLFLVLLLAYFWRNRPSWLFGRENDRIEVIVNHNTILEKVEALGRLELVRHNFKEVTELTEKNNPYLGIFKVPDSKAILITSGEAVGCIDLTKMDLKNIKLENDSLLVVLPEPELCYYKLDLQNSRIYSVESAVYYKDEKEIIERAYKSAEKQIRMAALSSGILEQTRKNAEIMLRPILEQISGRKVYFYQQLPDEEINFQY